MEISHIPECNACENLFTDLSEGYAKGMSALKTLQSLCNE
jgi:hypothetical protein